MTMMREPSMIMLIFLSAALATPAVAQTGNILDDDYSIMVPEKGSKRDVPEPWLAPKYKSPRGTVEQVRTGRSQSRQLHGLVPLADHSRRPRLQVESMDQSQKSEGTRGYAGY